MGNTRLKWRIRDAKIKLAQGFVAIESGFDLLNEPLESYRGLIVSIWVVSVVGAVLEQKLVDWSVAYFNVQPLFARSTAVCGQVRNGYDEPHALGADRWLGSIAAYQHVRKSCVVASFGTAITVDLVAKDGGHLGGYIAPGINLMLDSLISGTRQIKLAEEFSAASLLPATTTSNAIYSACVAMIMGLVNNGINQLSTNSVANDEIELIFTGGDAIKLLSFYPQARLIPELVLDGLACVLGNS
jgi:type III pantothenate kinase